MRGDLHPAAFRLLHSSRVVTHVRPEVPKAPPPKPPSGGRNRIPLIVDGVRYENRMTVCRTFKIGWSTLATWFRSGKAKNVD